MLVVFTSRDAVGGGSKNDDNPLDLSSEANSAQLNGYIKVE